MVSFDKNKVVLNVITFFYLVVNQDFFRINNSFHTDEIKKTAEAFVFDLYKKQHLTDMLSLSLTTFALYNLSTQ
jgi:hypothetical protein